MNIEYFAKGALPLPEITEESLGKLKRTQKLYSSTKKALTILPLDMMIVNHKVKAPWGTIPIRIYYPKNKVDIRTKTYKALIFLHGGGFILGDIETHHRLCKDLVRATGRAIISVDYSLAPEEKYPKALMDCHYVYSYVVRNSKVLNLSKDHIALGGTSAGGNLALGVIEYIIQKRRPAIKPSELVLQYPITDLQGLFDEKLNASEIENAQGYTLRLEATKTMVQWYVPDFKNDYKGLKKSIIENPFLSPIKSKNLSLYPKTLLISAEKDLLRDENRIFVDKLAENKVEFSHIEYGNVPHGFTSFNFKEKECAMKEIGEFLQ